MKDDNARRLLQNKGERKRDVLGPVSNGQTKELQSLKRVQLTKGCPGILSVIDEYRESIENFGSIELFLVFAGLRKSGTKVGFVMKIARGHAARGNRIYLDPLARNRCTISIGPRKRHHSRLKK